MGRDELRQSVVIAVLQGEESDSDVICNACDLAKRKRAQLRGLYVLEVPQHLPLGTWDEAKEAKARAVLEAARQVAQQCGCSMEGSVLPTRHAGQAIVDEAVEWSALGVAMAKPYPSRAGDAASYVLEKAVCCVLVWSLGKDSPGGQARRSPTEGVATDEERRPR